MSTLVACVSLSTHRYLRSVVELSRTETGTGVPSLMAVRMVGRGSSSSCVACQDETRTLWGQRVTLCHPRGNGRQLCVWGGGGQSRQLPLGTTGWWHLIQAGEDVTEQEVESGELQGQIHIAVVGGHVDAALGVGHALQEGRHGAPVVLQELVHEAHVGLLLAKPGDHDGRLPGGQATAWATTMVMGQATSRIVDQVTAVSLHHVTTPSTSQDMGEDTAVFLDQATHRSGHHR